MDFKCKMCGGALQVSEGQAVVKCEFCDTMQTLPVFDDEKKIAFYTRANSLRLRCEFDKAAGIYETIVTEYKKEAEAYWGLVLCKYGIEYVDDPHTGAKIPTCHRTLFTPIFEDDDYQNAIRYSDVVSRDLYEEEAKTIAKIQADILRISAKEDPFDIFICYKETDATGNRTEDSVLAFDIYQKLTKEGYKVFYSKITLEDKLGSKYEPYIFAALYSAKVMLVVTTSAAHCESVWVANEWKRYLSLVKNDSDKAIISCVKGISLKELPLELQSTQGIDMSKIGAMQDLLYGIEKLFRYSRPQRTAVQPVYEEDEEEEEEEEVDEAYLMAASYHKYVNDLRDLDGFIISLSEIETMIAFFAAAGDYMDSPHYLSVAKIKYAQRVTSYKETLRALVYLDEVPHTAEVEQLKELCKAKALKYRTKELQNQGLAIPDGNETTTYCLHAVLEGLAYSKGKQDARAEALTDLDKLIIQSCEDKAISYINEHGLAIVRRETKKEELLRLKRLLLLISRPDLDVLKQMEEHVISVIQAIENAEQAAIKQAKRKKTLTRISVISVLLVVAIIITSCMIAKVRGYAADNFTIEVISKTNDTYNEHLATGYNGSGYFYTFVFAVTNDSPHEIQHLSGIMDINNASGKTLTTTTVSLSGKLESGGKSNWSVQVNVAKGNNAVQIWNSDFSELEITFKIKEITFEDGTVKRYDNTKNEVVHACTAAKSPEEDDKDVSDKGNGSKSLLELVKDYAGEDAILPDNYESEPYSREESNRVGLCG